MNFDNRDVVVVLNEVDKREAERVTAHANKPENWHHGVLRTEGHVASHLGCNVVYSVIVKEGQPARHMAFWLPDNPGVWPGRGLVEPIAKLYGFTGTAEEWSNDCQETTLNGNPHCVLTLSQRFDR